MTVFAHLDNLQGQYMLGWQRQGQDTSLKLNATSVSSQAALAQHLPVQVFAPDHQDAWIQGPSERRKFMDWGAFYSYPDFLMFWRQYQHALKQRNQALKQQRPDREIALWHPPLWQAAQGLDRIRKDYVQRLLPLVARYAPQLSDSLLALSLSYHAGWAQESHLLTHWETHIDQDRQMGFTQAGPHRADLKIKVEGRDALTVLSRGQQKLLAILLLLVQTADMTQHTQESPVILLDDLPAELDAMHRASVFRLLPELNCQYFFTTTDASAFSALPDVVYWQMERGKLVS
jgi:DNA replication and repair protein RecF